MQTADLNVALDEQRQTVNQLRDRIHLAVTTHRDLKRERALVDDGTDDLRRSLTILQSQFHTKSHELELLLLAQNAELVKCARSCHRSVWIGPFRDGVNPNEMRADLETIGRIVAMELFKEEGNSHLEIVFRFFI
jgi:hypothetical protein